MAKKILKYWPFKLYLLLWLVGLFFGLYLAEEKWSFAILYLATFMFFHIEAILVVAIFIFH